MIAFEGSGTIAGAPGAATVTAAVSSYSPQHPAFIKAAKALSESGTAAFKLTTPEKVLLGIDTETSDQRKAEITNTGVVTFEDENEPTPKDIDPAPGMVLKIGSTDLVIVSVDSDKDWNAAGFITALNKDGSAPTAVASAETYSIRIPSLVRSWTAAVTSVSDSSISAEGVLTTNISMAPPSPPAGWAVA